MNRISIFTVVIALIFEVTLLINGFLALWERQWKDLGLSVLGIVTLTLPFVFYYFSKRVNLKLPPGFLLTGVIFIFLAQYFGEIRKFYQSLWWWDILLHGAFGALAVLFALNILKANLKKVDQISNSRFTLFLTLLSLCFSIACSALWEMFEFIGDVLLPVKMVKGGLEDTMTDLLSGALAASITALSYFFLGKLKRLGKETERDIKMKRI